MASVISSRRSPEDLQGSITRVLLIDDHPIVRQGLKMMIEREPDLTVCGEANGMSQGMKLYFESRPDVVVSDISLQNGSGIELVKELVAQDDQLRILVCSMHEESLFAERALRAGARGYIKKNQPAANLIAAVRCVAQGRVYLSKQMTDRLLCHQVGSSDEPSRSSVDTLSDRELQVFDQIGRGVTTRQIAENLQLSPKTVETYRANIKRKLNLRNSTELTFHAIQWVLESSSH